MKNTKKIVSAALLSSVLLFTACSDSRSSKKNRNGDSHKKNRDITVYTDDDMTDMASEILINIHELSNDADYLSLMMSPSQLQNIFDIVEDVEINRDEDIYVVDMSQEAFEDYIEREYDEYDELSDTIKDIISARMNSMISTIFNSGLGVDYIAANSILQCAKNYVATDIDNQMWIIPTNNDEVYMYVSFTNSGENVVTVTSGYVFVQDNFEDLLDAVSNIFDVDTRSIDW